MDTDHFVEAYSPVSIIVRLSKQGTNVFEGDFSEAMDFGRQKQSELGEPRVQRSSNSRTRFLIAPHTETMLSRDLLRVTPQFDSAPSVVVDNLQTDLCLSFHDGILAPQSTKTIHLPLSINLPNGYRLEFLVKPTPLPTPRVSLASRLGDSLVRNETITQLPSLLAKQQGLTPETILSWLNVVIKAMQCPASDSYYYKGFSHAVTEIADFDRAEVVLWNNGKWEHDEVRSFVRKEADPAVVSKAPSRTMLEHARTHREKIIHPEGEQATPSWEMNSLRVFLHSAIAYPLMDEKGEILGVLYADRGFRSDFGASSISDEEQRLIEILAAGITAGIIKSKQEQLVTKYQQFFSPKITEAIRQKPSLLAGEETRVTVLFCDIRGFSRIADNIGTARAMEWVSDTLSELSQIVLDLDGVLVDYVGDEMFAMWGAPESSEIHAFQAASAARLMMNRRAKLSERWSGLITEGFDFGIGLCTGSARVGNTGSKQKFKYGPMGRTVNLGSRIQGLTKQWRVGTLLDGITHASLPVDMLRRRISSVTVVGLDGALDLYELLPDDSDTSKSLVEGYEAAYSLFECGNKPRDAARAFGELVQRFPQDGPSLIMLVRCVNELVEPTIPFSPVWSTQTK